jgi:outer membrane protein OmpA-like peptidoglycan-associated protein
MAAGGAASIRENDRKWNQAVMRPTLASFILKAGVLLLAACGPGNLVVLIPDPDGAVGGVRVSNSAGSVEITAPHHAAVVKDETTAPSALADLSAEEVAKLFSEALAIRPMPPVHFLLYFELDSIELKPDSLNQIPDVMAAIRDRASRHISIVGHTDTLGEKIDNLDLSQRRALAVRDLLIRNGIPDRFIDTTSHGEKNLLIKTGDNVAEPRNRRVEVVVR